MRKNPKNFQIPPHPTPLQRFSPSELFQSLKENPEKFPHKTDIKAEEFYRIFFNFFIDYFYMQEDIDLKEFVNTLERAILVKMLDRFNGNQKDTAIFLGVNHTTLNHKVRKHKINFLKKPIQE